MTLAQMPNTPASKSRSSSADQRASFGQSLQAISQLLKLVLPLKRPFAAALAALFVGSGINLIFPEVLRRSLEPGAFPWVLEHLGAVTGLLALLFVVQGCAFFLRSYLFGLIGQRVFADVRLRLFQSIIHRDARFFDQNRSGDLASRINSDAALVQDAVSIKLSVIVRYGVQVLAGTVLMAWMSWRMTAAILVSVLCMVVVSSFFVKSLKAASRTYQGALAHLTAFAAECFSGAKIVRALGAEEMASRTFSAMNDGVLGAGKRRVAVGASFSSGASLLLNLLLLLVQWYGIRLVVSQELPLSDLAAFALYGAIVAVSFSFLISAYAELLQSVGGLERVFELIGASREPSPESASGSARPIAVSVEFRNVSFSYPERPDVRVLDNLSFSLRAGSVTGLVGPSGSGKSSIALLLLKFYAPSLGTIRVDNADIVDVTDQDLRAAVSWVPQEPHLFGFTVFENLVFGNEHLLREEVERLVESWGFLDFIKTLPDGLDTPLGEHGTQLSGGQRQRIAIARALLRKPGLLVLDEATSGLDSQTEVAVLQAIRAAVPGASLLIISHRLSTVSHSDTIIVINEGQIFEQGTHEELKAKAGLYQQYVARQALG